MNQIEKFTTGFEGKTISVAVQDLETSKEIFINADVSMHPASTMKVPVMMEVLRQAEAGLLSLDEPLKIFNSFKSIVDGSEFSLEEADDSDKTLYARIGESETIRELNRLMIIRSSNLATNLLMERVTCARVDAFIKELGIDNMTVIRGLEDKKAYRLGMNNAASARSSTQMMTLIAEGRVVSRKVCDAMIEVMFGQEFNESIPALLPTDVKVAHKTGWTGDFFHDTGIVFPSNRKPYAISLFTHGFPEDNENQAHGCMAEVSRMIYQELIDDRP
ncbi:MAG: serine hydrolase [Anaerolineales bacterium]|jgi:beta-lactamase class A|uniref:serine hydrolase n=1 Tax=Candidatus Villigracilis vicinus TaxID=3140679 RepID=UPI003134E739|nr:serine hydrolase [Anaerolineales bacterium]MBK9781045.1 serine hydrolase [Anaerolineales bacterium]